MRRFSIESLHWAFFNKLRIFSDRECFNNEWKCKPIILLQQQRGCIWRSCMKLKRLAENVKNVTNFILSVTYVVFQTAANDSVQWLVTHLHHLHIISVLKSWVNAVSYQDKSNKDKSKAVTPKKKLVSLFFSCTPRSTLTSGGFTHQTSQKCDLRNIIVDECVPI